MKQYRIYYWEKEQQKYLPSRIKGTLKECKILQEIYNETNTNTTIIQPII